MPAPVVGGTPRATWIDQAPAGRMTPRTAGADSGTSFRRICFYRRKSRRGASQKRATDALPGCGESFFIPRHAERQPLQMAMGAMKLSRCFN